MLKALKNMRLQSSIGDILPDWELGIFCPQSVIYLCTQLVFDIPIGGNIPNRGYFLLVV